MKKQIRYRSAIYVDVWVDEQEDKKLEKDLAHLEVLKHQGKISNSYIGEIFKL